MRKAVLFTSVLGLAILGSTAFGQARPAPKPTTTTTTTLPPTYLKLTPDELRQAPERFENQHIQIADLFGRAAPGMPRDLRAAGLPPDKYVGFTTHHVLGSNAFCVVSTSNKEALEVLTTLVPGESRIYLIGRIGPRVQVDAIMMPLFVVERLARGSTAPPIERKREVFFTIEWEPAQPGPLIKSPQYRVPEAGKRYQFTDPNTGKKFYMTFQF